MKSRTLRWFSGITLFALLTTPLFVSAQVGGAGTTNFVPIWTNSTTLGNSSIFQKNGKVGIGTIVPGDKIDVEFSANGHLLFGAPFNPVVNGTAPYFRFKCTSPTCITNFNGGELNIQGGFNTPNGGRIRLGGGTRGDAEVNAIQFFQGATETMRIQDGGNVGIGTTSPAVKLHVIGDFIATGTKSALVETASYGRRQLYAVESAENWFEDFGEAHLIQGRGIVKLDPIFAETVSTDIEYHVFLTPKADCEGLYIARQSANSFEVRELRNGKGTIAFDYRIVAKRRGYERTRLGELTDRGGAHSTEMKIAEK